MTVVGGAPAKVIKKSESTGNEDIPMKSLKFLSFSIAVCMICLLPMTSCSAAEVPAAGKNLTAEPLAADTTQAAAFSDVSADAWYAEAVEYCRQRGIMNGVSDTAFAPEETLTRAMLVTILWQQAQKPVVNYLMEFSDVSQGQWYSEAVRWAASEKLVGGYGDGRFGTNDPITQEHLDLIFQRYTDRPVTDGIPGFDGSSKPATRAQAAMAVMNYARLPQQGTAGGKVLVACFSATNTTRPLAEYAADILNADLYEIVPEVPYTDADLAYYTNGRADREQNDSSARPAISGSVENMADYDVIFLGYPIWHGQPPRIISTFLESYDFAGKTVVPFCTSHSSGYSDNGIKSLAPGANWITGRRFAGGTSRSTVEEWIKGLDLPKPAAPAANPAAFNFESKSVTLNSGYEMPLNGLGTYSLHGETCVNSVKSALQSGVRLIDTASAYGNEEEVGQAIREAIDEGIIKREDVFVITKIYPGSEMANPEQSIQACLDRLDIGYVDMMLLHHPDRNDVNAYQAMEKFVEEGKIRSLGLSNWYVKKLESFLPQVTITPALVQNEIHPYYQENDVIPYIQDLGIVVQGWYPLGGRGHTAELLGDGVISGIARAHGVSSAQVILRWNLQKGVVVIPGSSNPDHIRENTELYGFELTDAEMAQINALDRKEKHDWY
jgi:diketogulonate reductase-like aldo/keto reductase/flavodoxin